MANSSNSNSSKQPEKKKARQFIQTKEQTPRKRTALRRPPRKA